MPAQLPGRLRKVDSPDRIRPPRSTPPGGCEAGAWPYGHDGVHLGGPHTA
ncbi:hypothetical protein [Streptomyces cellulosae]|nr:hypothetical protein [Streptomyces cellulosae]